MASTPSKAGEVTLEYLRLFPNSPRQAIAKALFNDHPELFETVEIARNKVRYYTGSYGKLNREIIKRAHYDTIREPSKPGAPFPGLPEPRTPDNTKPVTVTGSKIVVLSDLHVPYHDKEALEAALDHALGIGCDTCVLLGDVIDFFGVSRWTTDPRERDLPGEIASTRMVLETLCKLFPLVYYKMGNHEERWERYLFTRAPELVGVEAFEIPEILGFAELGIKHVDRMRHLQIGHLSLIHGHEWGGRGFWNPVNAARGLFLRAKASSLCGHYHQTSEHVETTMGGRVIGCWSVGCLCNLKPRYSPYAKWNHGFATIESGGDAVFAVENHKILQGKVF